jgi:hypothetical protein
MSAASTVEATTPRSRPSVFAKNPDLNGLTSKTWEAITNVNVPPELFRRENSIVLLSTSDDSVVCHDIDLNLLRWWLISRIDFVENNGDKATHMRPPIDLLQNLLATPNPPLPSLVGIVKHPIFAADTTLQIEPGYSAATQRYYSPGPALELPPISPEPTPQEIREAKRTLLEELLGDFPFADDSSRSHALAALLLPFVRPLIHGPTPLHLIWKPKAGTGATLLAEILCLPSCGYPSQISVPMQEEERRRTLLAMLRGVPEAVLLDNVYTLCGAALASCLTQTLFEDRLVGSSKLLRVPNVCLWLATGNNPDLSNEIVRRTVSIHLDAKVEYPDLRTDFRHALPIWAIEQKSSLVLSALTLVQAWVSAGRPKGVKTLGKFESWAAAMGGILKIADVPGFLERIEEFRADSDVQTSVIQEFVEAWAARFNDQEVRVSDLLPLASSLDLGTGNSSSRSIRLGKLLVDRQGQRFGPRVIEKRGVVSGSRHWRLQIFNESGGRSGCRLDSLHPPTEIEQAPSLGLSTASTTSTEARG